LVLRPVTRLVRVREIEGIRVERPGNNPDFIVVAVPDVVEIPVENYGRTGILLLTYTGIQPR
jgi:hypothetical protein